MNTNQTPAGGTVAGLSVVGGSAPFRADYLPPGSEAVITKSMQGAYGVWFSVGERVTITGADYRRGVRNIKRVVPLGDRRELNELIWADVQNLSVPNFEYQARPCKVANGWIDEAGNFSDDIPFGVVGMMVFKSQNDQGESCGPKAAPVGDPAN